MNEIKNNRFSMTDLEEEAFIIWYKTLTKFSKDLIVEQLEETGSFDLKSWCYNDLENEVQQNGGKTYEDLVDALGDELIDLVDVMGYRDELEQMINDFLFEIENEE